jgi:hypothetical protein
MKIPAQRAFDGASQIRTGDLLGAILPLGTVETAC